MEEINIEKLLAKKIIIPEIQREYVWGNNKEVVIQFLKDLNKKLSEHENKINIGFLYTYEKSGNPIENYLIDGQQRFTTIFLLLVYLYKSSGISISPDFYNFGFRVRPLTEQFIATLLKNKVTDFSDLENEKWFVSDYNRDTSIKSICNLFKIIKNLELSFSKEDIKKNVYFWYFNVDKTSEGEELYITMNSRGEQLIDSEQIKPRLFSKIDNNLKKEYGKKWDDWEEYFFRNRPKKTDADYIKNVDYTLNNVIKICLELNTYEIHNDIDPVNDDITLREIDEIMKIFCNDTFCKEIINAKLFEILYQDSRKGILNKLYCLETYIIAWKTYKSFNSEANDLIYVINNAVNYGYVNHKSLLQFFKVFEENSRDEKLSVFDFILSQNEHAETCLNNVLKKNTSYILPKIKAIKNNLLGTETRNKITEAENFAFFKGQIHFLYNNQNEIDAATFKTRFEHCKKYFDENGFIDDDIAISFMQALYHLWSLKQEVYIFDYKDKDAKNLRNNIIAAPSLRKLIGQILSAEKLTDIKQCEIDTVDENIKEAWTNFIKIADSKEAIKFILTDKRLKGSRVRWNDGFAIYQRYSRNNGIIYLSKTCRDYLLWNTPGVIIESEKDGQDKLKETGLLMGWDISFRYSGKQFIYKSNNTVNTYDVNKKLKKLFEVDSTKYPLDEKGINNFEEELKKYLTVSELES